MSPLRRTKIKLDELLLQKGLINPEQLQEALSLQQSKARDKLLGQILIELGYVNKEELWLILAIQSGYPYIKLSSCIIETEVLSLIPKASAERYQVFPIDKIQDILTIAMVNPLDKLALEQIHELTKYDLMVFLTTPLELTEMISRYYVRK